MKGKDTPILILTECILTQELIMRINLCKLNKIHTNKKRSFLQASYSETLAG